MKKIIALLLALTMVFALVACASTEKPAETPADNQETEKPAENPLLSSRKRLRPSSLRRPRLSSPRRLRLSPITPSL